MKYLKKIEWLPDALSDGTIVTPTGPFTLSPEEAIKYADYRFNKQQSMMPYNTVIALNRGEDCADRNTGNITFTKTFLSKIGKAPVIIKSALLAPNTTTGTTEFDKTYPFWCLAVTIVSSEIDLTGKYLCLEACNTGHTHQPHAWSYYHTSFHALPLEAKKYLRGKVVKYKTIPDAKSCSFITTKIAEARSNIKLSVEGITQIENPKVGKTYYLYIALPKKYLRYKDKVCSKSLIDEEDYNTYIKFRPCIKYKRENTNDLNMYTLPLSWPYELNCKFPQIFYSAWSTNTTTLPPPFITGAPTNITSTYVGKIVTINYDIEWPIEDAQLEFNNPADWVRYSHNPEKQQITLTIDRSNITSDRNVPFRIFYSNYMLQQIVITQTGIPVINLESNAISATSLGGVFNINYDIDNDIENVTISTSESYDWITANVESSHIVITISENTNTSGRSGIIYVTYPDTGTKTITVNQQARPVITVNQSTLSLGYSSTGTYTINYSIINTIPGEVVICTKSSTSSTWFSVSNNTSANKITITVSSANNSTSFRTGYVYLDYGNAERVIITITQDGRPNVTTTTTTTAPSFRYTITATISGVPSSTTTSISAVNANTNEYGTTQATSGGGLTKTQTFQFTNQVYSMLITASAFYNGTRYTGSTTITPRIGTNYVTITVSSTGSGGLSQDIITVAPLSNSSDTLSGDSNSLEDILLDYETDQI